FETVCQRLFHECIPISQEQNVLRLVCSQKQVDQCHNCSGLARSGRHDKQCTTLLVGECFSYTSNRFVLVRTLDNRSVDRCRLKRHSILADEEQTLEIVPCKKSRDETRVFSLGIPIKNVLAVRHESERHKRLPFTSG